MEKPTLCLVFLVLGLGMAQSRSIRLLNSTYPLVDSDRVERNHYPSVSLGGKGVFTSSSSSCVRMYGFLPCADNVGGYIAVYKFLLHQGTSLLTLEAPRCSTFLASASLVAAYLAFFRVLWGMCVMWGSQKLPENKSASGHTGLSTSDPLLEKKEKHQRSKGSGSGIKLDGETGTTAGIMLVSLIPFVLVLFVNIFKTSSGSRVMILVVLIVSTLCLLSYFAYQIWGPLIQERSSHGSKFEHLRLPQIQERTLHYSKLEHLVDEFSKNIRKLAKGKLINVKGKPDIYALKSALAQFDKNIKFTELDAVLREMRSGQVPVDKEHDEDGDNNNEIASRIVQPWLDKRRDELNKRVDELNKVKHAMESLQIPTSEAESLLMDNGERKSRHIESKFNHLDSNKDNRLSPSEFKELVRKMKAEEAPIDEEELVNTVRDWLDKDGDQNIDKQEFVHGVLKWLTGEESDEATWKEVDSLLNKAKVKFRIYGGVVMNNITSSLTLLAIVFAKDLTWDYNAEVGLIVVALSGYGQEENKKGKRMKNKQNDHEERSKRTPLACVL
ncbi:hypothetical protein RJ639_027768 [Escallonia herrerae]|uniref:EF-hand domain-containing protein n=1 Tax=Escallonia herrerae TaxID=1293975 RepID=A0AA88X4U1_9ASTE|nr:hypothetical protein RJ639_027768 [Escallonia herrerae]